MPAPAPWLPTALAVCLWLPASLLLADDAASPLLPPADVPSSQPSEPGSTGAGQSDAAGSLAEAPRVPLNEEEQALLEDFDRKRLKWAGTLFEMKKIEVAYNNSVDRSPSQLERFYELRNQARGELSDTYDAAVLFFERRSDDFITGSFIATMIDYRGRRSYYDGCYRGAKLLMNLGIEFPKLPVLAARAALLEGQVDDVMPLYEKFLESHEPKDLERVDHLVAALVEAYPDLWAAEQQQRERDAQQDDLPRVLLQTTAGDVVLELFEDQAPNTVANFIQLVEQGYYDETEFYQVIDNLLAQGGDPSGDGSGTSGQYIPDEHDRPDARYPFRGSLLMAKQGRGEESTDLVPNSASSQFVITFMPYVGPQQQTVFGRVLEGMDVVGAFQRVDPTEKKENQVVLPPDRILTAKVLRKRNHDYPVTYTR